MMRKRSMLFLAVAALSVLAISFEFQGFHCAHTRGLSLARVITSVLRAPNRAGSVLALGARPVSADDALQFKPLPPESASRLEERHGRRRSVTPTPPETPSAPDEDITPPSTFDSKHDIVVGKSGNVMRIGSDVHIDKDQVVTGDLVVMGGDITVDGHVEGDVVALGGDVHLGSSARVDGDVASIGGELVEDPGSSVGGERVTASGVRGMRSMRHRAQRGALNEATASAGHIVASMIWLFILLIVAWGFTQIAPGRTQAALDTLRREPATSLGIGALVWALIIPSIVALALVVAILCITIIGIPIALAALLGYALFLAMVWVWGYVVAMAAVGEWVSSRRRGTSPMISGVDARAAGPSLTRKAVWGVLCISGIGFVGEFLQMLFFAPPLPGIGKFLSVVSCIGAGVAATFGAGAWLRTEFVAGTIKRWWVGRRLGGGSAPPPPPAPVVSPAPPAPPVAPSAPGSSFAPSAPEAPAPPASFEASSPSASFTHPEPPPPQS